MMNIMITPAKRTALMSALLSLLLIMNLSSVARAQAPRAATGALQGAISTTGPDGQSYNIPAASVKLSSADGVVANTASNDEGEYEFTTVLPGDYTLEVSVEGFKTASEAVTVRAGEVLVENISLALDE